MRERAMNIVGTLGVVLVLVALMPSGNAFAGNHNPNCTNGTPVGCDDKESNARECNDNCSGVVSGEDCFCDKRSGSCTCDIGGTKD